MLFPVKNRISGAARVVSEKNMNFTVLLIGSLIAGAVGFFKPSLVLLGNVTPSRRNVLMVYGTLLMVSFLAIGTIANGPEDAARVAAQQAARQRRLNKEKLERQQQERRSEQDRMDKAAKEAAERAR